VQFPYPELQVELQSPPLHARAATCVPEHARLQPPQCVVLVLVLTSHPSSAAGATGWVQFPYGELQVELHNPPLHDRLATFELEHARVQLPQRSASVFVLVSQPLSAVG
jgi:hypothetical protein